MGLEGRLRTLLEASFSRKCNSDGGRQGANSSVTDWSDEKKGQAIVLLTDDNLRNLTGLSDAILKGGLEKLLSQCKRKD